MPTAVIVDAVRTPLGRRNGKLKDVHPVDLAAARAARARRAQRPRPRARRGRDHGLRHAGRRAGHQRRPQRRARGRLPRDRRSARPIDRQCGSSQQAAHFAAQGVIAGAYDVVIAAGVENMTPRADGRVGRRRQVRLPVRPEDDGALPEPRAAGHLGRADRREVGHLAARTTTRSRSSRTSARRARPKRAASTARSCRSRSRPTTATRR